MEGKIRRQDQINLIMTLRSRGILDTDVLNAIERVPRHLFVSEAFADYAYRDMALPIAEGQTIPEPYIIAQICEALWLEEDSRVLVVGTSSVIREKFGLSLFVRRSLDTKLDTKE